MKYRLSIDIGTASNGIAIIGLNENNRPISLIDAGVRIYSDGRTPKDKTSLAVGRREARSARRRRDRYLRRRRKLLRLFTEYGLLPADAAGRDKVFASSVDPYELRARGLDEVLEPFEIGRAIYHLNQRRGFKSNRKSDRGAEDESGKIKEAVGRLRKAMDEAGARTLGEYLYRRHVKKLPVRVRMRPLPAGDGKESPGYDFYPDRALVEDEFDRLWAAQARHHPRLLTEDARQAIRDTLFFQRPLRSVRAGKCTFNPEEERLPKAHPLAQLLRIYQEANTLRVIGSDQMERPALSRTDRDKVVLALRSNPKRTFKQLRTLLKLPNDTAFNLESEHRTELLGDLTTSALAGTPKKPGPLQHIWPRLPRERRIDIVNHLLNDQDEEELIAWLMAELDLSEAQAAAAANARLADGYSSLGPTATARILAELEADVIVYSKACERAGYHHSDFRTGEIHDSLPYYGTVLERHVTFGTGDPADPEEVRLGRLTNPTVHIGLGQLRRVVNAVIRRYGHPTQIVVELARELKWNKKQKDKYNRELKENKARADRHRAMLAELGYPDNGENRLRLRLWEELNPNDPHDRRCPYTLRQIAIHQLFNGEVDIDHILPFSRTLDNSAANRTVCFAQGNKHKNNRPPSEAFGHTTEWPAILEYAQGLPRNKRWRFAPDAMERFEGERDFLDRQLVDTQYLSRITREYLSAVCDPSQIWVTPGRLTALLRRFWGLNAVLPGHNMDDPEAPEKSRNDHRHHAVDAIVVGLTDRGLLNWMSREAGLAEDQDLNRLMTHVPTPWDTLREDAQRVVSRIVVSHRPDHGSIDRKGGQAGQGRTAGQLHKETAYGIVGPADARGAHVVVHRVPLDSLRSNKDIHKICVGFDGVEYGDAKLRDALWEATRGLEGKAFTAALARFSQQEGPYKGLRRVRIFERNSVIPIRDRKGKAYKAYAGGSNFRFDVWRLPNGDWKGEAVTMFDAHQPEAGSRVKEEYPTARKIMKLRQGDMIAVEKDGKTSIMLVIKFSITGQVTLAAHNEANVDQRNKDKTDDFVFINPTASGLKKMKARQVRVDEIGRVFDPGPRD